jgi:hypothetical protein
MTHINNVGGINGADALDGLTKPARDDLCKWIRQAHEEVRWAEDNALSAAVDAGRALHELRKRISIPMNAWMAKYLPEIPLGTWKLYLRLGKPDSQDKIEAAREQNLHLSINEARKLITKRKKLADPEPSANPEPSTNPVEMEPGTAVPIITDEQLIAALALRGPNWMLENMPGWRAWLVAKLRGVVLRAEQTKHPDTKMKNIKILSTQHLKLVHSAKPSTQH